MKKFLFFIFVSLFSLNCFSMNQQNPVTEQEKQSERALLAIYQSSVYLSSPCGSGRKNDEYVEDAFTSATSSSKTAGFNGHWYYP